MNDATTLILVRHGETPWNDQERYQGQTDVPLSPRGRAQAERIAERLAREPVDAIVSSDLLRARDTAEVIARRTERKLELDPRLREARLGVWQGLSYADVHRLYFEASDPMPVYAIDTPPPDGESLRQLQVRVCHAVDEIAAAHRGRTVVLVSHGACLKVLVCAWLGIDLHAQWQLRFDGASLSRVALHPQGAIVSVLNDTAHLMERSPYECARVDGAGHDVFGRQELDRRGALPDL